MNRNASHPNNTLMKKAEWEAIEKSWEAIEKVVAEADAKCAADLKYEPSIIELKAKMRIVERAIGLSPPPPPPIPATDHMFQLGELAEAILKAHCALKEIHILGSLKDRDAAQAALSEIESNPRLSSERLKNLAEEYQSQLAMKEKQNLNTGGFAP
jgi:hypothetical protein